MSSYGTKTVTNSATLIIDANVERTEVDLLNVSNTVQVFLGQDASVTTSNGFTLYPNQNRGKTKSLTRYLGPIYGITASGTADVRYWETTGS